jgi:hypothetical protein
MDDIDVSQYKGVRPPLNSWDYIKNICEKISVELGDRLSGGQSAVDFQLNPTKKSLYLFMKQAAKGYEPKPVKKSCFNPDS